MILEAGKNLSYSSMVRWWLGRSCSTSPLFLL